MASENNSKMSWTFHTKSHEVFDGARSASKCSSEKTTEILYSVIRRYR